VKVSTLHASWSFHERLWVFKIRNAGRSEKFMLYMIKDPKRLQNHVHVSKCDFRVFYCISRMFKYRILRTSKDNSQFLNSPRLFFSLLNSRTFKIRSLEYVPLTHEIVIKTPHYIKWTYQKIPTKFNASYGWN